MRVLRNLRIDDVSCVLKGASPGARVLIRKSDDPRPGMLFDEVMKLRQPIVGEPDDPDKGEDEGDDDKKISGTLRQMVSALTIAVPNLREDHAMAFLLHHPRGRALARHLSESSKTEKDNPMQVDITKLHNIASVTEVAKNVIDDKITLSEHQFTEILTGHANLNKRTGESTMAALERIFTAPENTELRKAYALTKGYQPAG
jgi:hypothetical protein